MSAATRSILTAPEVIAVDQDPAGIQGVRLPSVAGAGGNLEVWCKPVGDTFTTKTVALFNRSDAAADITVDWAIIGLAGGNAAVRDLWARADEGVFSDGYTARVPSHGVALVKITGKAPPTCYVSDQHLHSADNGWEQVERDRSNGETGPYDGHTITLNGVTYAKGIGVHAPSSLQCYLGGNVSRVASDIGVDDEAGTNGSVVFRVWDGGTLLYDSGVMTGASPTKSHDPGSRPGHCMRGRRVHPQRPAHASPAALGGAGTLPGRPLLPGGWRIRFFVRSGFSSRGPAA
jgi:alpha-galactosidase